MRTAPPPQISTSVGVFQSLQFSQFRRERQPAAAALQTEWTRALQIQSLSLSLAVCTTVRSLVTNTQSRSGDILLSMLLIMLRQSEINKFYFNIFIVSKNLGSPVPM